MFLSKLSINRPVFIIMLTLALIAFGLMGLSKIGIDLFPNVDLPIVTVVAVYPGADSKAIENDVVKKIEDSVATLSDIKHIESFSFANVGQLVITFNDGVDVRIAAQDVRDKLAAIKETLPEDVKSPVVEKVDMNAIPILSLILKAPSGENITKMTKIADKMIKNRLQNIEGVGAVNMFGGRQREIRILMNPLSINEYNIPAMSFIQMMQGSFVEIPAGGIKMNKDKEEIVLKTNGLAKSVDQIRGTELMSFYGSKVKIQDIAKVEDGLEEEESASFRDLTPAIALQVQKQAGSNVVKMAEDIKKELKKLEPVLPEGYSVEVVSDNSPFIKRTVKSSMEDLGLGALFAVIIIFLFLRNFRASLIVAAALPTSIIGTFLFIKAAGFTLNYITTLALSLSVGLLVDDAIVVIENIFRHMEMGKKRLAATLDATKEIGFAVLSVTLTIIAVFGPIVYMKGMIGKIFQQFGVSVAIAVVISLLVSFTLTPLLSAKLLKEESKTFFIYRWMETLLVAVENTYVKIIAFVLRHKAIVFTAAVIIFISSLALTGLLKKTFMDQMDEGDFDINIELPGESSLDQGKEVIRDVVQRVSVFKWQDYTFSTVGGGASKEKNKIVMRVKMKPLKERTTGQFDAMDETRKALDPVREKYSAKIAVNMKNEWGGGDTSPIQVSVAGSDYDAVKRDAAKMIAYMQKEGSFTEIINSDKGLRKELNININHGKMADLGVNPAESGMVLRYLFSGEKVANYKDQGEMYDIKAYLDPAYRNLDIVPNLALRGNNGQITRLGEVASVGYGTSEIIITRLDRSRLVKISSSMTKESDLGGQIDKLKSFAKDNFDKGNRLVLGGDAEMMDESFTNLIEVLIIAIFLIYIILSSQFNSFIHPLTIMSALPFAATGAIVSLYITDMSLSIMSFIGLIMLMGLVTKNSILLVDFTIKKMEEGADAASALMQAGKVRLRPILMTTMATIFGMIPVAIATGEGVEMKHPLAWSVIGGIMFSTLITLFIVPVVFSFFDKISIRSKG